jgi:hypothetical protein
LRAALLINGLAALFILSAVGCQREAGEAPEASSGKQKDQAPISVTVYSSPTCGCCGHYESYLEAEGFAVKSVKTGDLPTIKGGYGIAPDMQSCHTTTIDGYFVEGHVPAEAIWKLLEEQPQIDGIALPGMPPGSPGMGGEKEQAFTIFSIVAGKVDEFMVL